jgi:TolA-binding protein
MHAFLLLDSQIGLMINALELQSSDLTAAQRRVAELTARVAELEETLSKAQKEVIKLQDTSAKLQQDLMENVAQKEDQVFFLQSILKQILIDVILGGANSYFGEEIFTRAERIHISARPQQ